MDPEQIKKTGELLTREDISCTITKNERREQSWIDRHYHGLMMLAMLLELGLLFILVLLEWLR